MPISRKILFLQGPTSAFWRELAIALESNGHKTFKIHLALGDQLWWFRMGGVCYRGRFSQWYDYLRDFLIANEITDVLYYADRQPYHVVAQAVCNELGVNAIAIENGYLRPDWITFERNGMGVFSYFPTAPDEIRRLAKTCADPDLEASYRHGFGWEIFNEIMYHGFNYLYRPLFPFYKSGRYYDLFAENLIGLYHLFGKKKRYEEAERVVDELIGTGAEFFVVALQLQGDKQIQDNSPFRHLGEMIDAVVASFATSAAPDAKLVFKQHPHDNGGENWPARVAKAAERYDVAERVLCIDGGDLYGLLRSAKGCVTVNSTVGLHALRVNCPMKVLGIAVYDVPGLTHQEGLDTFWRKPTAVDASLRDDFMRALAATIQAKGSFYDKAGRKAAIKTIIEKLEDDLSTLPHAEDGVLPRMKKAHEIGVFDKLPRSQGAMASDLLPSTSA